MRLFVINPDHDEALAAHTPHYTPSLAAQRQAVRLRTLPAERGWLREGDRVWVPGERVDWSAVTQIVPWGWDKRLVGLLRRAGAPEALLPSGEWLDRLRELSSRRTAVRLLPLLRTDVAEGTVGESVFCTSEADALDALRRYGGGVVKAPWSCSGRGVFRTPWPLPAREHSRLLRLLRRQGGVAVEPYCPHECDFAMEFHYAAGAARYLGLNAFRTDSRGQYIGNLPPGDLPASAALLAAVRHSLERHLPQLLANHYSGPLGIDMMTCGSRVHPCVEINLRLTMGTPII